MRAAQRGRPRAGALVVLGVAILLAPTVLGAGTSAPWLAWTREIVEGTRSTASPHIALLPSGAPIVSYGREGGSQVATRVGGAWLSEPLSGYAQSGLAIDPSGTIHMSLRTIIEAELVYAKKSGSEWTFTPFPTTAGINQHPITASSGGQPHIGYRTRESIYYGTIDPITSTAVIESVDARGISSSITGISIALDSTGSPHIAYGIQVGNDRWDLVYASRNPDGSWSRETALVGCGFHTSMAIAGDTPHMSCQDESRGLIWVTRNASGWIHELVDATGSGPFPHPSWQVGRYTDIAVGPDGIPQISYWVVYRCLQCVFEPGQLHHATKTSNSWSKETVDRIGQSNGRDSSIVVDNDGRPRIAYTIGIIAAPPFIPVVREDILYAEPLSPVKLGASP